MATGKRYVPPLKVLAIPEQAMFIRMRLPGFKTWFEGSTLVAVGELQPCELCHTYCIRLEYRVARRPKVEVLSPTLQQRDGERIPHMFDQKYLCLFLTDVGYWTEDMELAMTIIPWASLWLYYYELWHATGEWLGGGHEPEENQPVRNTKEEHEGYTDQTIPNPQPGRRRDPGRVRRRFPR